MNTANSTQEMGITEQKNTVSPWSLVVAVQYDPLLYKLMADLSPEMPWSVRKDAAQKLGSHEDPEAMYGLMDRLPVDPFWMVRCAIIQALERIGDDRAIPALRDVAKNDGFRVVRSYAAKAVEMLS